MIGCLFLRRPPGPHWTIIIPPFFALFLMINYLTNGEGCLDAFAELPPICGDQAKVGILLILLALVIWPIGSLIWRKAKPPGSQLK